MKNRLVRINMIMCSNGLMTHVFFKHWYALYKELGFKWRLFDFNTGFNYPDNSMEIVRINRMHHGPCLNHMYTRRKYPIELFCDLDSFPVYKDWIIWLKEKIKTYCMVAAEDIGPIRSYAGKVAPSFMAFSNNAPANLNFTANMPTWDTAHSIVDKFSNGSYLLLNQEKSDFGYGSYYSSEGIKIWYHQWYLRKESSEYANDAKNFFKSIGRE